MQYYLKAEFHFDKDQFADLMIINGIAGIISQVCLVNRVFRVTSLFKLTYYNLFFASTPLDGSYATLSAGH